jgi:hypothetical protein
MVRNTIMEDIKYYVQDTCGSMNLMKMNLQKKHKFHEGIKTYMDYVFNNGIL